MLLLFCPPQAKNVDLLRLHNDFPLHFEDFFENIFGTEDFFAEMFFDFFIWNAKNPGVNNISDVTIITAVCAGEATDACCVCGGGSTSTHSHCIVTNVMEYKLLIF